MRGALESRVLLIESATDCSHSHAHAHDEFEKRIKKRKGLLPLPTRDAHSGPTEVEQGYPTILP
jgi:hypothetical protein